jgi:hypothetical protein
VCVCVCVCVCVVGPKDRTEEPMFAEESYDSRLISPPPFLCAVGPKDKPEEPMSLKSVTIHANPFADVAF